ncbi:hypothetical protein [Alkalilimnicola ehrlichii]|uniref:hypothetical protein n=1 Tax=Alkalilimnicola ehrlichii TaxID=351052 RepID=UPI0011C01F8E|nr:hypothetical protein [Alkalilimnicola ehrlichii]
MSDDQNLRIDFESAMGEEFGDLVSPPIPFNDASPHECCEAIWQVLGDAVTPTMLAKLTEADYRKIAASFGNWFECEPPTAMQIAEATARTLSRWPAGSLNESA